jgi:hypothetical protein
MGQRTEALARDLEAIAAEFAETIKRLPDDRWNQVCEGEGWTVAQVAQHVAGQIPLESEYIFAAARGEDLPAYSWDDINEKNDSRAAREQNVTKDDVLLTLETHVPPMAAFIRGLTDEQLDIKKPLKLADGAEVTTQQVLESGILIDHFRGHMKSIKSIL